MAPRRLHWISLVAVLAGCTPEVTLLETERQPGDTTRTDTTRTDTTRTDTTTVQRAALVVTARVEGGDLAVAARAGMPNGVLPGAVVTIQRRGSPTAPSSAADSGGVARFTELLPGNYSVSVVRILTEAERSVLTGADTIIVAFGGGREVAVDAPETEVTVSARASGRGSLVISEVFPSRWLGSEPYPLGTYMEIYNNTDTTIYLDGKLTGNGSFFWWDQSSGGFPCEETEPIQNDPEGLWVTKIWRFPGTGTQYPLAPGASAVLVTDAVDHSQVDPRWPDLSRADFEFPGSADADNAAVPNMILAAQPVFDDVLGHGQTYEGGLGSIWYLADALDVATLPTVNPYGNRPPLRRIPREAMLEVFMGTSQALDELGVELCPVLINEVFDRLPWTNLFMSGEFYTIQRRVLSASPTGRPLLQWTRMTRADFVVRDAPTPGIVP